MLEHLKATVSEAGHRIMDIYERQDREITYKADDSPLTLADRAAHDCILKKLQAAYPDIPVISEEGREHDYDERVKYQRFFLVDPLDGTKEFIKRNGEFTVNIALIEDGKPVMGVVGLPTQQLLYAAEKGQGAYRLDPDRPPVKLRASRNVQVNALRVAVSRSHPSDALTAYLQQFDGLEKIATGSSLKFCKLAEGLVDFYPRFQPLREWDTAAAHGVVAEAGVDVVDWQGKPVHYNKLIMNHQGGFLAAASDLVPVLLRLHQDTAQNPTDQDANRNDDEETLADTQS